MIQDLRYPIGDFDRNYEVSPDARKARINIVCDLPHELTVAVQNLNDAQFDTPYRPGGWTVRQTVHHIADSHSNALIRFKLALTENEPPTIKPYYEDRWAELADNKLPIDVSLKMVDAIHARWAALLQSMSDDDFKRTFVHPESGEWTLEGSLAQYAWHSLHHTAHITHLRKREGW